MTATRTHVVHVTRVKGDWSRWTCTCGQRSALFTNPAVAGRAGRAHAKQTGGHFQAAQLFGGLRGGRR